MFLTLILMETERGNHHSRFWLMDSATKGQSHDPAFFESRFAHLPVSVNGASVQPRRLLAHTSVALLVVKCLRA